MTAVLADRAARVDTERARTEHRIASRPMLAICSTPGCNAIVFGEGSCVRHDPPDAPDRRRARA